MKKLPVNMEVLFEFHHLIEGVKKAHDEAATRFAPQETNLLLMLDQPRRMGELAERLFCKPSNLTAIVDKLESEKLIKRERCDTDRRAISLVLTAKGLKERENIIQRTSDFIDELSELTAGDFEEIQDILERRRR